MRSPQAASWSAQRSPWCSLLPRGRRRWPPNSKLARSCWGDRTMSIDLQGNLRFWVFLVVLIAQFSAALFRPDRIQQRPRFWLAAGLLAFTLFIECVAPLFFSPSPGASPTSGMQAYLTAVKVITVLQHGCLAAALFMATFCLFIRGDCCIQGATYPQARGGAGMGPAGGQRRCIQEATYPQARGNSPSADGRGTAATPPKRVAENACLSCGQRIPPNAAKCPACGWTWANEEAASG